jgi:hypothetical protein
MHVSWHAREAKWRKQVQTRKKTRDRVVEEPIQSSCFTSAD